MDEPITAVEAFRCAFRPPRFLNGLVIFIALIVSRITGGKAQV